VPPLPVVPNVFRGVLHTQLTGGPIALTRFFMKYTGAVSATDATTMTNTIAASWLTRIAGQVGTNYQLAAVQIDDLSTKMGVNVVTSVTHPGTNANQSVPAAVCMVISAHVAYKYRGGHSRVYFPGLSGADLADTNTWSLTAQGAMSTAWTGLLSDLALSPPVAVGSMSQVAVHAYSSNLADFPAGRPEGNPPWPLATPVTYPITGWSTNPQAGSQRRRNQQ
jgi:hypothetical protein